MINHIYSSEVGCASGLAGNDTCILKGGVQGSYGKADVQLYGNSYQQRYHKIYQSVGLNYKDTIGVNRGFTKDLLGLQ